MTFNELLESYDPIDLAYRQRFFHTEYEYIRPALPSFIPNKEELEKIFLLEPLKKMREQTDDC